MRQRQKNKDATPLFESLGGTSADRLKSQGKARQDGKSLSRIVKLIVGERSDFLRVADSGPGEQTKTGLIVPKFGNQPENHVAVSMTFEAFSELLLLTKAHYEAWLAAWYQISFEKNKSTHKAKQKI